MSRVGEEAHLGYGVPLVLGPLVDLLLGDVGFEVVRQFAAKILSVHLTL